MKWHLCFLAGFDDRHVRADHSIESFLFGCSYGLSHLLQFTIIDNGVQRQVAFGVELGAERFKGRKVRNDEVAASGAHIIAFRSEVDGICSGLQCGLQTGHITGRRNQFNKVFWHVH